MSVDTDRLRDIFLDITDNTTLTEHQQEDPSREPIGEPTTRLEDKLAGFTPHSGLTDTHEDVNPNEN